VPPGCRLLPTDVSASGSMRLVRWWAAQAESDSAFALISNRSVEFPWLGGQAY